MFWIKNITYTEADAELKRIFDRVKGPKGQIDHILMAHSVRPHTLTGHMALYKNVLHHANNSLPKWYLETIGVYVSFINHCDYCVQHHFAGLKRLWASDKKSEAFYFALTNESLDDFFEKKWVEGLQYAKILTLNPKSLAKDNIDTLKRLGFSDGEVLEINQVVSYFNYANRTVLGLGVHSEGDILGLSPGDHDDPNNWTHQ